MEYEISPKGKLNLGLKELWEYRELFFFFTWRDIKVKYKQTFLGIMWVILQPAIMAFLFVAFFKRMVQPENIGIPYSIFVLSGLIIWTMFSGALSNAGNSMVTNSNIIKKIYFPRLIIPISAVLTSLFDLIFGLLILIIAVLYFHTPLKITACFFWPLAILVGGFSALGMGILLAALNVKYRDFRYIIPFFIQIMLFVTPVIYPLNIYHNKLVETVLLLNPVSGAIELFRAGFENYQVDWSALLISISSNIILFLVGLFYFRHTESYFADIA